MTSSDGINGSATAWMVCPAENKWCEPAGALAANSRAVTFSMIHEFQRIVPVETPVGYGSLLYVESAARCRMTFSLLSSRTAARSGTSGRIK
jgi:hypothetical protein